MPTTIKTVKGKQYLYYSYYDPDEQKKKEIYCGQSDTKEAKKKALQLELEQLKKQKQVTLQKIIRIEYELNKIS
jgi:hypothetical protein